MNAIASSVDSVGKGVQVCVWVGRGVAVGVVVEVWGGLGEAVDINFGVRLVVASAIMVVVAEG
jgi:hypothetical protein